MRAGVWAAGCLFTGLLMVRQGKSFLIIKQKCSPVKESTVHRASDLKACWFWADEFEVENREVLLAHITETEHPAVEAVAVDAHHPEAFD